MTRTIVFSPDENFCKYFAATLQSLIDNSQSFEDYEIIILDADISNRSKKCLMGMLPPNFSLKFFNITEYLNKNFGHIDFKTTALWSLSTYYRLFIPMIMQGYEKVLYCDSDIIFNRPIDELFEIEFEIKSSSPPPACPAPAGQPVAALSNTPLGRLAHVPYRESSSDNKQIMAVLDTNSAILSYDKETEKHFTTELKLKNPHTYFNAGIIMFNIPAINIEQYSKILQNTLLNTNLKYLDQDALNIIFDGKTKLISCKWNYQWGMQFQKFDYEMLIEGAYKEDYLKARQNPAIIHYTTQNKPWNSPKEDWSEAFWQYARKTPFYEEIIYSIIKISNLNKLTTFYNYNFAKILSIITFGKIKKYYEKKRDEYKKQVRDIRKIKGL